MNLPKTTLEQWQVVAAIVEEGGFAQAAARLHRSQSAVSYAVARLQEQLGVALFRQEGRRMLLTEAGAALLRDAHAVLAGAHRLERRAAALAGGWEAEVRLAADSLFPLEALLAAFSGFADHCRDTRLQVREEVMSGVDDALLGAEVDLAIAGRVPQGFLGEWLLDAEFIACVAPTHPLAGRDEVSEADLRQHVQVVLRDSGSRQPRDEGWLGAAQRWTVSQPETGIAMVERGLAFAWLARHRIRGQLAAGGLRVLPLVHGGMRKASLYLVLPDAAGLGPAGRHLADCLRREAAAWRADGGAAAQ
ncbi:LysR family transcriptional regulator [Xenophilus sp. AP218F]|nr:LysR family transcriptional regulator [Xenophilus sp. AP218F]